MYEKKQAYFIFIVGVIILIAVIVWFVCAGRGDVSNLRHGADDVRTGLTNAGESQQREAEAIDRATEAAERSSTAITDSQRTAEIIQNLERTDAEIIAKSRGILERVRERGGTENPN